MNNMNTLMSMVAGLNLTPVHRLKKTWKKISNERRKEFEKYHHTMSPDASYKLYRAALTSCVPPALPYL